MVKAFAESEVEGSTVDRSVGQDGARRVQQRQGYTGAPNRVRHFCVQGKHQASPLPRESRSDLLFMNKPKATKPLAKAAGLGFALQAKRVAQLLRRN